MVPSVIRYAQIVKMEASVRKLLESVPVLLDSLVTHAKKVSRMLGKRWGKKINFKLK